VNGSLYCSYGYVWTRSDAQVITAYSRIQRIYTLTKTSWTYAWSNAGNSQEDAAANLGSGGALVQAGLTKVQSVSAGVTFSAGHSANYDAAVQYDHRAYNLYCINPSTGLTYYSGVYEWRPYMFTGGNTKLSPQYTIFTCNSAYKISISSTLWVAQTTSYTYTLGASYSGVGLHTKQTNSSSYKLTFVPTGTAYLCGSNSYPVSAVQVREV
jgi:hypothetical protein